MCTGCVTPLDANYSLELAGTAQFLSAKEGSLQSQTEPPNRPDTRTTGIGIKWLVMRHQQRNAQESKSLY
jgi:hypothetical protein